MLSFFRAPRGTGTFSPPQADFFWGLPEQRYGKTFPFVLLLLFLTFSALVANPKKTTLHGGQSRSWSAEQGKKRNRGMGTGREGGNAEG